MMLTNHVLSGSWLRTSYLFKFLFCFSFYRHASGNVEVGLNPLSERQVGYVVGFETYISEVKDLHTTQINRVNPE